MKHLDHFALPWNLLTLQLPNFHAISNENNTIRLKWTCSPRALSNGNDGTQPGWPTLLSFLSSMLKMTGRCAPFPQNTLNSFSRASTLKASQRLIYICMYIKRQWGHTGMKWQSLNSLCVNTVSTSFLSMKREDQHPESLCQVLVTGLVAFIAFAREIYEVWKNLKTGAGPGSLLTSPGLWATRFRC